jgi:glycerophosphoryl diester phosphodiesterase
MLTLDQLLSFAEDRGVRFNLEIKTDFVALTDAAVAVICTHRLGGRVELQSFDLSALLHAHRVAPELRTIALFADLPGLEPGPERLAGMSWAWRQTYAAVAPRVRPSGGLESLGLAPDGHLWAMLEKPLVSGAADERPRSYLGGTGTRLGGDDGHAVRVLDFDPVQKAFGPEHLYRLDERAVAAADLQLAGDALIVLERDDTQGDPSGFKRVFALGTAGKRELADLNRLDDGDGGTFTFPFWTIESALPVPGGLAVMNDDNYPFSCGRHVDSGEPDDTELIIVSPW